MATVASPIYIVILDFEATCWDPPEAGKFNEIIEWPSVMLRWTGDTVTRIGEFREFVRPTENPVLTDFCKSLTGITQDQVDGGDTMENVMNRHLKWMADTVGNDSATVIICTCGDWDLKTCLRQQCARLGVERASVYQKGLNIKFAFRKVTKEHPQGMYSMLEYLKLALDGRHHSGMDDTRNITKIFERLVADGYRSEHMKLTKCP